MRILVVEDYGPVRGAVVTALRDEGWTVEPVGDGRAALAALDRGSFDLVVLDIMLPAVDGIRVLEALRAAGSDVHVLIVTARDAVEDRVAALDAGADDYLVKPFAIEELVARARALLRRKYGKKAPTIRVGPLELDPARRRVRMDGEPVELTSREYGLLETLAFRAGEIVTREEVHRSLYGYEGAAASNVVDVYIGYLRRKLEARGHGRMIHTRRGRGFLLEWSEPGEGS